MRWQFGNAGGNAGTISLSQGQLLALPFADPFNWQVFWEDFSVGPPVAATAPYGWQVAGTGSAASQVGLALLGAGQVGEGGSSLTIATGSANNNATVIYPAAGLGLGFAPFVTRLGAKASWILATRVSRFRQASANCFIGMDATGIPTGLPASPSGPHFYSGNGTVYCRWGAGLSIPLSGLKADGGMVFDELLAHYAGGYVTVFVNGQNLGSTAADPVLLDTNNDCKPLLGLQTLTAASRGIGVDYFLLANSREPV
jgi:hypothetical protein